MSHSFTLAPYSESPVLPIASYWLFAHRDNFWLIIKASLFLSRIASIRGPTSQFKGKERMLNYGSLKDNFGLPRPPLRDVSCFLLPFLDHSWFFVCGPGEACSETCSKRPGIFFTGVEPCFVLYPSPWKTLPLWCILRGGGITGKREL